VLGFVHLAFVSEHCTSWRDEIQRGRIRSHEALRRSEEEVQRVFFGLVSSVVPGYWNAGVGESLVA